MPAFGPPRAVGADTPVQPVAMALCPCGNCSAQCCCKKMVQNAAVQFAGVDRGLWFETIQAKVFQSITYA